MVVAFLSRRCADSAEFSRLLARSELRGETTVVYIEETESIPWYVDAVPTLVVQDGETIEVYAQDDAFSALGVCSDVGQGGAAAGGAARESVESVESVRSVKAPRAARERNVEPCGFDGEAAFEGVSAPTDEPDAVGCGANFERLIDGEDDEELTEMTMREWEKGLAAERGSKKGREGSSADKQLELLMQQREAQTPAPVVART
jgi:hypothetical protein